ncbi:1-(5-phosphoribosyl)-5-[(5-phosphoribosylamino)methylideneamino]imidazole-4-carboxamide isomerase [Paramaledivibacter caminithermalis]|uniref:1-(5-phosphoribosyl)-5-[(5-phosphoribosylamino)methylideneamino] imidazole-4-carboxamide isomerase n=1 Tax=Paramaledivibacter caminithermalis (strain DSM 15212 / CIP 107654 / DViRD3) TaxID=1121301 RepID=A0A1M6K9K5_PARC5|nr:1-(5-phosphoribosyl)-5-[(5-phosphoribosylamino)methylideneamino]imidazole-4-carboxamide isomerase [Paramaledivibacter caminithermalis]SHJ55629.1 1-(5-phosphoribosyl)-5-[(5-phosphoribosylamino)methylideneamino] imidazole-4-carboxamide isomerase [Paramaledivibacter caminithermalis DSM 15212]
MIIFPAVDIKDGKCVRLYQGKADKETVYNDDPLFSAKKWEENGAKYLHIVDLDGAFTGELKNKIIIKKIADNLNIPIQVGGGIRNLERAKEILSLGVERIIVGTSAVKKKGFVDELVKELGQRVVVSIDAKEGYVCVDGWVNISSIKAVDFAKELEKKGIKTIVYTDISKDGTMIGPNFDELKRLKDSIDINIIASGGIGSKEHVDKLKNLKLYGAIIGKALYEGKISLKEL